MYQVQGNENTKIDNLQQGNNYSSERSAWGRPQLMVWSKEAGVVGQPAGIANSSGDLVGNTYPLGIEGQDFIITSDHNRSALSVDQLRLENRMRMVGGNMRSYYTGQKVTINCSWNLLPSRAYQRNVNLNAKNKIDSFGNIKKEIYQEEPTSFPFSQAPYDAYPPNSEYTADGGAGGADLLQWYRQTHGPFYVFLSYDNYPNFEKSEKPWEQIENHKYSDRYHMYFTSFNYSVEKRGLYDFWNVSVSLEEA